MNTISIVTTGYFGVRILTRVSYDMTINQLLNNLCIIGNISDKNKISLHYGWNTVDPVDISDTSKLVRDIVKEDLGIITAMTSDRIVNSMKHNSCVLRLSNGEIIHTLTLGLRSFINDENIVSHVEQYLGTSVCNVEITSSRHDYFQYYDITVTLNPQVKSARKIN